MSDLFYQGKEAYSTERSFAKALLEGRLSERDQELIIEYTTELQASKQITDGRVNKISFILVNWRRFIQVQYDHATISMVYDGINKLKKGNSVKGKPFKQNTLHDYIRILKPFLLWLIENEYSSLPEKKILKISSPSVDYRTTEPDEILTVEEIEALLQGCQNSRDRALIATLYESGARIAEIGRLRWRDVCFDDYGVRLYIDDQKNQKCRFARLTLSTQYLAIWKNDYSEVLHEDAPVFSSFKGGPMGYVTMTRSIQRAAKFAGIEKRIHPHLFRKSRITHMIAQGYQESVIKQSMWGNVETSMLRTYIQLAEKDIDNEFLKRAGVKVEDEGNSRQIAQTCGVCHTVCGPTFRFCPKCGTGLSEDVLMEQQLAQAQIEKHHYFQKGMKAAEDAI